ncbi:probable peptide/nitrate transporter At3g43790 [Typha angustifolia]|uniref:probable peptide/nitrate transporter At3g43790 n=1 Tax=Typha angustifolia TaxID=59011 RepID=UPI003C30A7CB
MAAPSEPLLKKVYHASCPGCKLDQKNEIQTGIPYKEFFYIWVVTLCSALPIQSLFPYLYFMIRDLHVAKQEEDIGFFAGFVGTAYMCGRTLTAVLWGVVADRYGRKPVIVISILSVIIFNTLFGLSTSYWMAIVTRALLGLLCGLLGPIKAYASEVCRKEHQALGLSLVTSSRAIALVIGPAIGGFLSQPAEKYPRIFSQESLFGRFPYFLPCLCISLIAVGAFIACFWLPETLHMHHDKDVEDGSFEALEASVGGSDSEVISESTKGRGLASSKSLLKNWPLMSAITLYCVFSLHDTAYAEIFSLWAVSDKKYGGLSFSSQDVGLVLSVSGFGLLVYQLLLYPLLVDRVGPIIPFRAAAVLAIPLLACYPFMTNLSGITLKIIVNIASFLKNGFSATIIIACNILQNTAVTQEQRGVANGISVTAMSIFKAIAPAGGGILFSWAQKHENSSFLPGDQMVFFILNVTALVGLILTCKPFLTVPSTKSTS